nr:hypothetical protein [Tanacetum cinerariifolium]
MLVAMPFYNLEIRDSNDPLLGVYIKSRFSVNSETVELLTFTPLVSDSPKGVLVIVYWLIIFAAKGTFPKIFKVVVDEVCKWNDTTTSVIRLLPNDTQAPSGLYTTPSSIQRSSFKKRSKNHLALPVRLSMFECFLGQLARSCSNHNSELEICESNSHYGYECSQRVPLVYEPEPCYIQNFSDNNSSYDLPSLHQLIDHHCSYECGNSLNDFFCYQCTCKFCGNGAHVGYNCPTQVPSIQTLPSFQQQSPCCEDSEVTHEPYNCQPKNHDYYNEQTSCFDSNSFGFDQSQPQQYFINHPIFTAHNDCLDSQIQLNSTLAKITEQMTSITSLCEMACNFVQKKLEEKQLKEEQAAKAQTWKLPVCYDNDDDKERSDSLDDNIISGLPPFSAITPNAPILSTEEPHNSLSMGDEHLDTISATESDEFIKFGVENLIPILSESEGIPDLSSEVMEIVISEVGGIKASNDTPIPFYDPIISRNPLNLTPSGESDFFLKVDAFLAVEDEFTSSQFPKSYLDSEGDMLLFEAFINDDHFFDFKTKSFSTSLNSLLEETNNFDNSLPEFTTFLNVLCDAECESDSSDDQSCFDEDVLEKIISKPLSEDEIIPMKSLRTHDSSLSISSKIETLLDEFAGKLIVLKSISPGIDETDYDFEEDICLIKKLLYDNSSPRPPEEFVSVNSNAAIKSFSPSPILVKDSDSLIEEIDLLCTSDYPMPPGIVDKDYDSERDILIPKDLPSNNSLSFAEKESFHFDIPPFSRPPAKPPDGDTGILNIIMMGNISDQKAFLHKLMITLASHQEKSPDLLSHRCRTVKKFNTHRSYLNICPMLING